MSIYERGKPALGETGAQRSKTVLIVDDHPGTAELLGKIFALKGYEPLLAASGRAAIEVASRERPGAMLIDMALPDIRGQEICRYVRSQPWGEAVMIIGVSGWAEQHWSEEAIAAGCDHYLVKPVRFDTLEKLLDRPRSADREPRA